MKEYQTANQVLTINGRLVEILSEPYIDETIEGKEVMRAPGRYLETGARCEVVWPIKKNTYSDRDAYIEEE